MLSDHGQANLVGLYAGEVGEYADEFGEYAGLPSKGQTIIRAIEKIRIIQTLPLKRV